MGECQADEDAEKEATVREKLSKGKSILDEVVGQTNKSSMETFTSQIQVENEFRIGLTNNLTPWIDKLELESLRQLEKPANFEHARKIEQNCVVFAKEVRRANKLLSTLEGKIEKLPSKKLFANQQIQEQKLRFKNIATVAATRVETMRELLVNWNFFMEVKGEADRLTETVRGMFELEQLVLDQDFVIDQNDFVHGLPKVLMGWIFLTEKVLDNPPKPGDLEKSVTLFDLFTKFGSVVQLANKVLERVEEVTEKTDAQPLVWEQRCKMKKIISRGRQVTSNVEKVTRMWRDLEVSEKTDNIDFQPLVKFLAVYSECYA